MNKICVSLGVLYKCIKYQQPRGNDKKVNQKLNGGF